MWQAIDQPGKFPFVGITLATMAGILVADSWRPALPVALAVAGFFLVVWILLRRSATLFLVVGSAFLLIHSLQFDRNAGRQLAARLDGTEITVSGSGIVDSVPSRMVSSNGKVRSRFQLGNAILSESSHPVSLLVDWPDGQPGIGDKLEFEGNLKNVERPRNPGEFDYAAWLARQQIFSVVTVPYLKNAKLVSFGSKWNLRRIADDSKRALAEIITRDLLDSPVEAGVISAMMLGAKDDTPDGTLELFMKTGTFHLFSVSGLHITMLAAITLFTLLILRVPRNIALLLTIPAVFGYALITGWSASSVRAAIMTSVFIAATFLDRPSLSINTLAIACFMILIGNTNQLFAAGFQLSFSVVAVIILFSEPLASWLQKFSHPDPFIPRKLYTPVQRGTWLIGNYTAGKVAITVTAWLGSLPMTAIYFSLLSPSALVANLLVIPLSFAILVLALLSLLSSTVCGPLVLAFNNSNWLLVKGLLALLGFFSDLPGSSLFVGPHWWQQPDEQRVTVFDLKAGGAMAIETSDSCWLVDCGTGPDYRRVVRQYLQKRGINRVKGIFLTHGDGTHVGGITQFRADFPDAAVYLPKAGQKSLAFRRLIDPNTVRWISSGRSFSLGQGATIKVLWPPTSVDGGRADDHALILKLSIGGEEFLLVGDSGFVAETELMSGKNRADLRADWLVMGRSRDDPGGVPGFLKYVKPHSMVTTVTDFPSPERLPSTWAENCKRLKVNLLRQDQTGAVQVELDNNATRIKTFARTD